MSLSAQHDLCHDACLARRRGSLAVTAGCTSGGCSGRTPATLGEFMAEIIYAVRGKEPGTAHLQPMAHS